MKLFGSRTCFIIAAIAWGLFGLFPGWILFGDPADATAAPTKTVEPFAHERRAALWTEAWGGMRVDWTAVADWPIGDSPAAKAVRTWIEERLRSQTLSSGEQM